ncbi:MAG: hypothetical protein ACKOYP_14800 [Bacteroidota bacterium]
MKRISVLLVALVVTASAVAHSNDVLVLANNHTFRGDVLRIRDCQVVFRAEHGGRYTLPASDIALLQFGDPADKVYTDYLALTAEDENACMKGAGDGKAFHGKAGLHVVLGVLFGPIAMIGAAVSSPNPVNGARTMELSKNSALFSDPQYLECYRKSARGKNVGATAAGWGIWILLLLSL